MLRLRNEKNGKTTKEAINNIQFCRIERSNMTLRPVFRSNVIENPQPVVCSLWLVSSLVNTVNNCTKSELLTLAPTPQQEPAQQLETPEPPVVDDPWLMTADIATPMCHTTATIATPKNLLLLPPASEGVEQPELDLTALKLYKLHGHSVTKVADLPVEIPATIKRYKLHKKDVVRLIDLEQFLAAL